LMNRQLVPMGIGYQDEEELASPLPRICMHVYEI
jgi:hypothetical protein